ncbi:4789_t:CDS:1 [Cetraspora pellucida]|uniref:4789_t:CDS:1 n=1 Tax=Cetraspora pellucida TaxID=1433469 RepID=A0ACA9M2S2_9GLOM|nr:4789_t:CDS:1 [Cetraspora pellucida]
MASISIDPGGRTGIYYKNGEQEQFIEINKPWKETYGEIKELVKGKLINLLLFENTNYIHKRTKDGLNLFRLLGAIECLEVQQVKSVNVLKVKEMTKRLLNGIYRIKEIEYKKGRGKG